MRSPITREQHEMVVGLDENFVRMHGYCYLVWWVPDHGLHSEACR